MGDESWPKTNIEFHGGGLEGGTEVTLQLGNLGSMPPSEIQRRRFHIGLVQLGLGDLHVCG